MTKYTEQALAIEILEKLWTALKNNYPMMEYAGALDDSWFEECKQKIQRTSNLNEALLIMDELVRRLNDYHTRLYWEGKPIFFTPAVTLSFIEEQIAVLKSGPSIPAEPGDIVLEIDGKDAVKRFRREMKNAFGPTRYAKIRSTCRKMIEGPKGSTVKLKLLNPANGEYELILERKPWVQNQPPLSSRSIDEEIGYIRISRWADFHPRDFDATLEEFREKPYLIIDVRDNGGGSDKLAADVVGRFIKRKVLCSISFHRRPGTNIYEKTVELAEPRGEWQYEGKVAVLTNEGCASACEHFVSGMLQAGAVLLGLPTSGACGWQKAIELPGNVKLLCSVTFPLHGKIPSPLNGIPPHHLVTLSLEDLRSGRDTFVEQAVRVLRNVE